MFKAKFLIWLAVLPFSMYLGYGPPIKNFMSQKFEKQLLAECQKQSKDPRVKNFCLEVGRLGFKYCENHVNILQVANRFPKCIAEFQRFVGDCVAGEDYKICLRLARKQVNEKEMLRQAIEKKGIEGKVDHDTN